MWAGGVVSIYLSIDPPIHPSIHQSIYLSIYLSICLSIYLLLPSSWVDESSSSVPVEQFCNCNAGLWNLGISAFQAELIPHCHQYQVIFKSLCNKYIWRLLSRNNCRGQSNIVFGADWYAPSIHSYYRHHCHMGLESAESQLTSSVRSFLYLRRCCSSIQPPLFGSWWSNHAGYCGRQSKQ